MLSLNTCQFPKYLEEARLVAISKKKGEDIVGLDEIRPLIVASHLKKIIEKAIRNKIKSTDSKLLNTGKY